MKDGDTAGSRILRDPDGATDTERAAFWEAEARRVLQIDLDMRTYFAEQFIKIEGECPATWQFIKAAFERLLKKG